MLTFYMGVGVKGITWTDSHGQTEEFTHEIVLKVGYHKLEIVQMCLWSNETRGAVDHKRVIAPAQPVTERFTRGHIYAVVLTVGHFTALPGL